MFASCAYWNKLEQSETTPTENQLGNSCDLRWFPFFARRISGIRKRRPLLTANHTSRFRRASAPVKYRWSLKRQKWFLGEALQATERSLRHQQKLGLVALVELVSGILDSWHVYYTSCIPNKFKNKLVQICVWSHPAVEMNDERMPFLGNLLGCLQFFNATKGSSCDTLGTNIVSFGKAVLQESSLYSLARSTEPPNL